MAKRKRLSPANPDVFGTAPDTPPNSGPNTGLPRAPIADVAGQAAATAALNDVTHELAQARAAGRMVLSLRVEDIVLDHIVRDRMAVDAAQMAALMTSIADRGQQTPIEVLETDGGGYGLISGWRRCQAIAQLEREGRHDGTVLALLRRPADASETYQAMVEENEIRVGLSYFERARIAAKAVQQGVFDTEKAALLKLFASASRAKRSKIRSFLPLVAAFDGMLRHPHLIGERLGLSIAAALEDDPGYVRRVRAALEAGRDDSAQAEQAALTKALVNPQIQALKRDLREDSAARTLREDLRPGLQAKWHADGDWLQLSGDQMTSDMRDRILDFVRSLPRT